MTKTMSGDKMSKLNSTLIGENVFENPQKFLQRDAINENSICESIKSGKNIQESDEPQIEIDLTANKSAHLDVLDFSKNKEKNCDK